MDLKNRAKQLKKDIPALLAALRHKDTPKAAKIMAFVTAAYALSPVDLIPDFIPFLGYLDDVILLPALIALTVKLIPPQVLEQCRQECGKPVLKKWYWAIPVVGLWAALILFVISFVLKI